LVERPESDRNYKENENSEVGQKCFQMAFQDRFDIIMAFEGLVVYTGWICQILKMFLAKKHAININ